jgi:hypothetical protein
MYKKNKSFNCRSCKERIFTGNSKSNRCLTCNKVFCKKCLINKKCMDCFINDQKEEVLLNDIYEIKC